MDIARHLAIGLIEIRDGKCNEVLSSQLYTPMRGLNLLVLDQLGYNACQFCGYFFETGGRKWGYLKVRAGDDDVQRTIDEEKGLMFWNYEVAKRKDKLGVRDAPDTTYERRFVCPECVQKLLAIQDKRMGGWFSDHTAESVIKLLAVQEKKIKTWVSRQQRNR